MGLPCLVVVVVVVVVYAVRGATMGGWEGGSSSRVRKLPFGDDSNARKNPTLYRD